MAKKFPFESILPAAGERFNFPSGKRMDLDVDQAKELLAAEAVRPLDPKMPKSFYPSGKSPAPPKPKGGNAGGQAPDPNAGGKDGKPQDDPPSPDAGNEDKTPDPNAGSGSNS